MLTALLVFVVTLIDRARQDYFMTYLGEILLAIHEDKIPIAGAFAWGTFSYEYLASNMG